MRWFLRLKAVVFLARNEGIRLKKQRFLKLIRLILDIITFYLAYYQCLVCNAENKRFLSMNDNASANIGCMCGQNSLFVDIIHSIRRCTASKGK